VSCGSMLHQSSPDRYISTVAVAGGGGVAAPGSSSDSDDNDDHSHSGARVEGRVAPRPLSSGIPDYDALRPMGRPGSARPAPAYLLPPAGSSTGSGAVATTATDGDSAGPATDQRYSSRGRWVAATSPPPLAATPAPVPSSAAVVAPWRSSSVSSSSSSSSSSSCRDATNFAGEPINAGSRDYAWRRQDPVPATAALVGMTQEELQALHVFLMASLQQVASELEARRVADLEDQVWKRCVMALWRMNAILLRLQHREDSLLDGVMRCGVGAGASGAGDTRATDVQGMYGGEARHSVRAVRPHGLLRTLCAAGARVPGVPHCNRPEAARLCVIGYFVRMHLCVVSRI
jgi:hypothetical protein